MTKVNIREALNQMDKDTNCKYDLVTLYEGYNFNDEEKKEIAKMISDDKSPEEIYDKLIDKFSDSVTTTDDDDISDIKESFGDDLIDSQYLDDTSDGHWSWDYDDDELANIYGGDTKYDNHPDGVDIDESLNEEQSEIDKKIKETIMSIKDLIADYAQYGVFYNSKSGNQRFFSIPIPRYADSSDYSRYEKEIINVLPKSAVYVNPDDDEIIVDVSRYYSKVNESTTEIVEDSEETDDLISAEQEFDSAATSINSSKLPAVYNMVKFNPGDVVVDFGGGKFDNAVNYLKDQDVTLLVYDPYNRSAEHNKDVLRVLKEHGGADAAVNSNVLNVIKETEARNAVLQNIKKITKKGAPIYITVYEGTGKGNEGPTKSGYQLNRKTSDYMDEISQVFSNVKRKGKLITAINESLTEDDKSTAFNDKYFPRVDINNTSRYDTTEFKDKFFAYDKKNNVLIYLFKDDEEVSEMGWDNAPWRELDSAGLSSDNWNDKESREDYLHAYTFDLDSESSYLVQDFIDNELPYYQNKNESLNKSLNEDTQLKLFDDDMINDIDIIYQWRPEEVEKILVKHGSNPNNDTWIAGLDLPAAYDEIMTTFRDKYSDYDEIDYSVAKVLGLVDESLNERLSPQKGDRVRMDHYSKLNNGQEGTVTGRIGELCWVTWDDGTKSKEIKGYLTVIERDGKVVNESKSIKESSLVDKKVSTLGKKGKPMYFTAAQLKDAKAKYPEYDFEETTIEYSLPAGQKAYIARRKTNESKSIKEDYSDEVDTLRRYLDVEVPDICREVLDLVEHLPSHKISYATKICRDFYTNMENIINNYIMTGDNLKESSYGGAFDIADDEYFTKEDGMIAANEVAYQLEKEFPEAKLEVMDMQLDNHSFYVVLIDKDGNEFTEEITLDMRKIRHPLDLIKKYAPALTERFIKQIKDYYSEM